MVEFENKCRLCYLGIEHHEDDCIFTEDYNRDPKIDRIINLERALKDCISYIDVDNLTMQAKYKEWERILND